MKNKTKSAVLGVNFPHYFAEFNDLAKFLFQNRAACIIIVLRSLPVLGRANSVYANPTAKTEDKKHELS
ncbi:MAG: hypothetical protein UD963_07325 [Christensenellales bacterium]|nr:hypothetical protein [Christensenellales bacterium]